MDAGKAPDASSPFGISRHIAAAELRLSGELDIAAEDELEGALDQLLMDGCSSLTVNLSRVTFMDLAALRTLVRLQRRMVEHGGVLHLMSLGPQPQRLLRLTRMTDAFNISDTEPPTVKALPDPS